MDALITEQVTLGDSIERLIINYKKDSKDRKTSVEYFQLRLTKLKEAEFQFMQNNEKILQSAGLDRSHDYFKRDYYTEMMARVSHYCHQFEEAMRELQRTGGTNALPSTGTILKTSLGETRVQPDQEFTILIRKQQSVKASIRRQLQAITESTVNMPHAYDVRAKTIQGLWMQVEEMHHSIYSQWDNPEELGYSLDEYVELEDTVQDVMIGCMSHAPQGTTTHATNMPKISIPKFDGEYTKWPQFCDLFTEMVHKSSIPTIEKFWHLKANLMGEAGRLIQHFNMTTENYESAWATLKDRYNNIRTLTSNLLNRIINQPGYHEHMTANNVKNLHDTTKEALLALNNIKVSTASWDPVLLFLLVKKLDKHTHNLYEQTIKNPKENQTIGEFLSFLEFQFQSLEAIGKKEKYNPHKAVLSITSTSRDDSMCVACKQSAHPLFSCKVFLQWSISKRAEFVKKQQRCFNCLKPGHVANKCISRSCTIKECNKKHNSLLHSVSNEGNGASGAQLSANTISLTSADSRSFVLLGTARVKIISSTGMAIECRALLDAGSQVNIMTERLVKRLGLKPKPTSVRIQGIGTNTRDSHQRIHCILQSRVNAYEASVDALVLPKIISKHPSQHIDLSQWNIPRNITLADPNFNQPGEIDLLLGAEFYLPFLTIGQIRVGNELPILQNTVLGWTVTGKIGHESTESVTCGVVSDTEGSTDDIISKFWRLDDFDEEEHSLTQAETQCETHFMKNTRRNSEGKYVVRLPLCRDPTELGESYSIAHNRFLAIERRLAKDQALRLQYVQFMREYEGLGHMVEIRKPDMVTPHYFIPHHCVIKADSSTTKLRVVFDASCKTKSGLSLNDIMHNGPRVQSELFSILLRFRLSIFAMTTDVEKMYRQIFVHPDDDMLQLIIWREHAKAPLKYYRLRTVTYGTRAAPYLATKCLTTLAKDNQRRYPIGAEVLKENFYVDDGLFGSNSLVESLDMQKQLITILQSAGMKLRKWSANNPQLLDGIPSSDKEVDLDFSSNNEETIKTLGLTWLPKEDQFQIKTKLLPDRRITKRTITSDIARIFDPLGLLSPVVVTAKIIIQRLWQLKLDWDEAVPVEIHTKWSAFRQELQNLHNMKMPRHVFNHQVPSSIQLHAFADASERAYGAAIYVRAQLPTKVVIIRLLCAKSRIAPLKTQTIPRLELCAALLAAQLMDRVKRDTRYENVSTYFWSDSEIVLNWINTSSGTFQTFVAHRVSKIQRLSTSDQWHHVRSKDNPADLLSRGVSPKDIDQNHLWFYGPLFLHGNESLWPGPFQTPQQVITSQPEVKTKYRALTMIEENNTDWIYNINHKGSFSTLQRILVYVMRFVNSSRKIRISTNIAASTEELEDALIRIAKTIQQIDFKDDIKHLKANKELSKNSAIQGLSPFIDDAGVVRVGGRLSCSSLSYNTKHPILLPYNDKLVKLLMEETHQKNLHCGPQALLAHMRQKFWPIKGKITARSVVQHCVRCTKARPALYQQIMGDLPAHRVQPARPFVNVGVDYCGPFWVHFKIRGKRPQKTYIAVFCCFATKAVHLELVSDLTTEAFIGALKRFIARRGCCQNMYCDNATNFVGAKNELQEMSTTIYAEASKELIVKECTNRGIQFHFIPPRAPHFGGLWEAAVKSAKHLLVRTTSTANLTYEELETVVVEIEAVLNSRPITPLSSDPNDLCALTPGHFLIGEPLNTIPDSMAQPIKPKLLTRWKLVSHLKHEFWKRWSMEYLTELQQKHKWSQESRNVQPGQMVIIKEDNTPTLLWPIGRVMNTYKGNDGSVRVVDVKTAKGIFKRPIHRLAPLLPEEQPDKLSEPAEVEVSQKRARFCPGLLFTIIVLMLPLALGNQIKVTPLNDTSGFYFEQIGKTKLITSHWNLVVYFDLQSIRQEIQGIANQTATLYEICNTFRSDQEGIACRFLTMQLNEFRTSVHDNNMLLSTRRTKRGAFDIVGNVAHSLFGVLDSEYATQLSQIISNLKDDDTHMMELIKNQTSIIDSTVNLLKREDQQTKNKFDHVDQQMQFLLTQINEVEGNIIKSRAFQVVTTLYMQIVLSIMKVQEMQTAFFNALVDTHHGNINPIILSPVQLREEIFKIKTHLSSTTQLPVDPQDHLHLYSLMKITGTTTADHVIFNIRIPLVDVTSYDIVAVNAIPKIEDGKIQAINSVYSMLAFTSHRDTFFPLSREKLKRCQKIPNNIFLCSNIQATYNPRPESPCEVLAFINETPSCNWATIMGNFSIVQTFTDNRWIFATTDERKINGVCNHTTHSVLLSTVGIIELDPGCTIRINSMGIRAHNTIDMSSIHQATQVTMFAQINSSQVQPSPIMLNTNPYQTDIDTAESIHQAITQLKTQEQAHTVHHQIAVSYVSLTLSILGCIGIIWTIIKFVKNRDQPPIPTPRRVQIPHDFRVSTS